MIATNWSSERNVITKAVAHDAALTLRYIFKVSIFNHVKNSSKVKFESVMWLKLLARCQDEQSWRQSYALRWRLIVVVESEIFAMPTSLLNFIALGCWWFVIKQLADCVLITNNCCVLSILHSAQGESNQNLFVYITKWQIESANSFANIWPIAQIVYVSLLLTLTIFLFISILVTRPQQNASR